MFVNLYTYLQSRLSREEGQTMAEYGVVLGVITILVVGAFTLLGTQVDQIIREVAGRLRG